MGSPQVKKKSFNLIEMKFVILFCVVFAMQCSYSEAYPGPSNDPVPVPNANVCTDIDQGEGYDPSSDGTTTKYCRMNFKAGTRSCKSDDGYAFCRKTCNRCDECKDAVFVDIMSLYLKIRNGVLGIGWKTALYSALKMYYSRRMCPPE